MLKETMLIFISKVIWESVDNIYIWKVLDFIEKNIIKSDKEQVFYLWDQEVWKATYYLFMFDDLWEDKSKWLHLQKKICITYFYDLFCRIKWLDTRKE